MTHAPRQGTVHVSETAYGVVLADRVQWLPVDLLGEQFGSLSPTQRDQVTAQVIAVVSSQ